MKVNWLKNSVIAICLLMVIVLLGCSNINSSQKNMYENIDKILSQGDSYTYKERIVNLNKNSLLLEFSGFYGKETIWEFEGEDGDTIDFTFKCSLAKEQFKVYLVYPDNEVDILLEGESEGDVTLELKEGSNRIIIVGTNAKGSLNMTISKGLFINE